MGLHRGFKDAGSRAKIGHRLHAHGGDHGVEDFVLQNLRLEPRRAAGEREDVRETRGRRGIRRRERGTIRRSRVLKSCRYWFGDCLRVGRCIRRAVVESTAYAELPPFGPFYLIG